MTQFLRPFGRTYSKPTRGPWESVARARLNCCLGGGLGMAFDSGLNQSGWRGV
jgi:hypothetical protein